MLCLCLQVFNKFAVHPTHALLICGGGGGHVVVVVVVVKWLCGQL